MTKSEKRGGPFPEGASHDEAKLLAPHPVWDEWKSTLLNHFGFHRLEKETGFAEIEPVLAEWYRIRRLYQLGKIDFSKVRSDFELKHPKIFEDPQMVSFLTFISEKTSPQGKTEKSISRR